MKKSLLNQDSNQDLVQKVYSLAFHRKTQMGVVVIFGILLLAGCGSEKFSTDSGSVSSSSSALVDTAEKPVARCSSDRGGNSSLGINTMVFSDSTGTRYDKVRVKIVRFSESSPWKRFSFSASEIDSKGSRLSEPSVQFALEKKMGGTFTEYKIPNPYQLNWTQAQSLGSTMGVANSSRAAFFDATNFIVQLPDATEKWSVLNLGLYQLESDPAGNPEKPSVISVLLPPLYINPNQYKTERPDILYRIHPFYEILDWDNEKYRKESERYCF